ncbi:MAG: efflux RND transporter permease subunit [Pseudomonadales bacterium]|nr:efflux RND transporter permease subunit [Pseudomonadales bacterium]
MSLPGISIDRHIFAFMLSALIVLFGLIAYRDIGVDQYPQVDLPMISITTVLPGADPEVVDTSITNVIENAVNSVPGIDNIASSSSPGVSIVRLQFHLEKDVDVAFNEVQAKVNQTLRLLPDDADPPIVGKIEVGASPVMWLSLTGDRTLQQLNQYAENVVKKRLETIDGVGQIQFGGGRKRTIRVEVDLDRMAALGVTAQDISQAFRAEHLQAPGGFLVSADQERLIQLDLEFHSTAELASMIVTWRDGAPVTLGDFAVVVDALSDFRQVARFMGRPSVGLGVVKISNANTVAVIEAVERRIAEEIRPQLPAGMQIEIAVNDADIIRDIVAALEQHLVEGTVLAGLVVWFFLRSFRSTIIIATAIPVSLLGAVAAIYFLGYTFNQMTLLALLLLIGVVVDDAIVVLENIYRHREDIDPDPLTAAREGSNQVVFAVVASSLTLVSIFVPVVFMQGMIGRFFESFAVVVTIGVLVSLFVSLTLTPMLCSRFLEVKQQHGRIYHLLDSFLGWVDRAYIYVLDLALRFRWGVVAITVLTVLSSGYFFAAVPKEFMPSTDQSRFIVALRAPLGSSIDSMDRALRRVEETLHRHSEVRTFFAAAGGSGGGFSQQVNQGVAYVTLVPRSERDVSQAEFIQRMRRELAEIPGVRAFVAEQSPVGGQRGDPLQFTVVGPELPEVAALSQALFERMIVDPRFQAVDLSLQLDLPQVEVDIDRPRAAALGLSAQDVAFAVSMLAGGLDIARYNDKPGDGHRYDVRVKARDGDLRNPDDLHRIMLRARGGELVRLDSVAEITPTIGAAIIDRLNLRYAGNFYVTPAVPLGEGMAIVNEYAADLLPPGYQVELLGEARELERTVIDMLFAFALAIILVFMVLASQFNSLVQPLIVMVAQPLAVIGGVVGLWIMGKSLNVFSMIGMVLLIGLVAKNSILLVDLTNQLRRLGRGVDEALREACPIRLRPVLMTSLTVILALTPAALGFGAGADTNAPLAVAVIGGMASSTMLTLAVVPAVYSLYENWRDTWGRSKNSS